MKILSYSPSIEVYVAVTGDGGVSYYDVSPDVTRATVTLGADMAGRFAIHLQNRNGKYDDVFTPMDRVRIYLTKTERHAVLVGYIKSAPKFSLYRSEVTIQGRDTISRLQDLFWDPALYQSRRLLGYGGAAGSWDEVMANLLVRAAGYSPDMVRIGKIPQKVVDWAYGLYAAQQSEADQIRSMADEFHEMLSTTGPKLAGEASGTASGAADFTGSTAAEKVWNFCISQGFSQQAAAATIGNAMQESSCDPGCMQSGGGPGRGLFQWEIGSDRYRRLEEIASSMGKEWSDIEPQLTLFQEEAEGCFRSYTGKTYTYPNGTVTWWPEKVSYSEWKTWTDIPKATECLERVYMRPSVPNRPRRISLAQQAYDAYAK